MNAAPTFTSAYCSWDALSSPQTSVAEGVLFFTLSG